MRFPALGTDCVFFASSFDWLFPLFCVGRDWSNVIYFGLVFVWLSSSSRFIVPHSANTLEIDDENKE